MDLIRRHLILLIALLFLCNAYAAKDPIGWSMSGSIPTVTSLNHSYSMSFIITSNLPFTMPTPLQISNNSSPNSEVTMVDDCSGLKLAPNQSCIVGLVLIPKSTGQKSLSVFMEYGKNKVMIPRSPLTSTTQGDATTSLQALLSIGFPTAILSNTTYTLSFEFVNNTSSTLTGLSLSPNANNSPGFTQTSTNNCTTLLSGGKCTVTGTFTTTATSGPVTVGYTVTANGLSATVNTSSVISASGTGVRTFTFVNNCSSNIWFGLVSGNVNGNPCKTNSDCAYPSICNSAANGGAGLCFYPAPVPANGVYELTASGGTNTASIADYGFQFVWSGNLAGRTGCTSAGCVSADCGGGTGACPTGRGFDQPATLAEFTLLRNTIDSYDLSILNGTNVAIQVTPTTTHTFANHFSPPEYNCSSPGKVTQTNGLGNCSWTFDPSAAPTPAPVFRYRYVTATSNPGCNDATSCPVGTVCGLNFNQTTGVLNSFCGTLLGYNTPNQVCSYKNTNTILPNSNNNVGNPYFDCDSASGVTSAGNVFGTTGNYPAGTAYSVWALLSCQAQPNMDLNTCFNGPENPPASTTNCCGCVDWATFGSGVVVPSDTITCKVNNTIWTSNVLPGIVFMKRACPTAYAWPFDDKSSSFGCDDISSTNTTNTVNYTITFCPS